MIKFLLVLLFIFMVVTMVSGIASSAAKASENIGGRHALIEDCINEKVIK